MTEQTLPTPPFDLLLRGGHVIDPANSIDAPMDVAIQGGKIARVAPSIPAQGAARVVDVSGRLVTPGILDIHTHVYPFRWTPAAYIEGMNPDAHLLASGVTTTLDVGTAGWEHFLDFKEGTIDRSKVRVLALVNIARRGMVDASSEQVLADLDPRMAASLAQAYPDIIIGIKSAHYRVSGPFDELHPPWASVDRAVEAAELCGGFVMVDFWPRPPERPYPDLLLQHLRPGDIHTHVFARHFPVLSPEGKVNDFMFAARERGVLFDLGHGAGSFWFRCAVPALADGFPPDTLSTDLHMGNINGPVASMQNTMSKYLSMGMPLQEVIFRSTQRPAQVIRRPDLGTLSVGAGADVAVFNHLRGAFSFSDCGKARMDGAHKLECILTLRDGQVVYDAAGLSMPEWHSAPPDYWQAPG
jgi:dihydroorotase